MPGGQQTKCIFTIFRLCYALNICSGTNTLPHKALRHICASSGAMVGEVSDKKNGLNQTKKDVRKHPFLTLNPKRPKPTDYEEIWKAILIAVFCA
jgi:hypothetical protein